MQNSESVHSKKNEQPVERSLADPATKPHSTGERHVPGIDLHFRRRKGWAVRPQRHPSFRKGKSERSRCAAGQKATPSPQPCDSSSLWGGREPSPWPTVEGNPGTPLTTFLPLHKPRQLSGSDQIVLPILDTSLPCSVSPGQRRPQWHWTLLRCQTTTPTTVPEQIW